MTTRVPLLVQGGGGSMKAGEGGCFSAHVSGRNRPAPNTASILPIPFTPQPARFRYTAFLRIFREREEVVLCFS